MVQAMMSGVASIEAQQTRMNVIGNDLANINTTAFKSQDVNFDDLISQQLQGATPPSGSLGGTNGIQYGLGVKVGSTTTDMSQGSLSATSNPADLAVQGNGFFMVSDGTSTSYTRDGSFQIDANGDLVSADTGQEVLGWSADSNGNINTNQQITASSTLQIPLGNLETAQATSTLSLTGNLDSAATSGDTGSVTATVYDSLGDAHDVTIQFSNPQNPPAASPAPPANAVSSWDWTAYAGDSATGTPIGGSTTGTNTPLYFDANGAIVASTAANTITLPASGGASASTFSLDPSSMQQLGASTDVVVASQNGFPPGSLQGFSIGKDGVISGDFSNGLNKTLGQVALATFTNPSGLNAVGTNMYIPSANSGIPNVGTASTGSFGSIESGFLEQSNVDLSTSLTNLIITQRGFEANTKIVSTVDQLMQELIQMTH